QRSFRRIHRSSHIMSKPLIDLRSDTVTRPTPAMRAAMAKAEVGDDVYGEDPTINRLEQRAAEIMGKEAALFVPTGTMGNVIGMKVHMDGARIFNASAACGHPVSRIAAGVDTVMFCLSKGLGAPVGSVVAGSAEAVERGRLYRKRLGGGMRQAGILAAAGLIAL